MINPQEIIKNLIKESVLYSYSPNATIDDLLVLEHPADVSFGDYSCNIAMKISAEVRQQARQMIGNQLSQDIDSTPLGFAQKIVSYMNDNKPNEIEKIEVAGAGFINFYLSKYFFGNSTKNILEQGDNWGKNTLLKNKKILVEHSSPNLFKPFHIGHVMNNTIGESITRLAHFGNGDVTAISYPSDVSLGIAKAVYVLMQKGLDTLNTLTTLQEKLTFLGECYVEGTKLYDQDEDIQKIVRDITQKIFDNTQGAQYDAYTVGKNINLDYFKQITKTLGSDFVDFIYESEAGRVGKKIVLEHVPNIFTQSDGAIIYEGEKEGLHTRVFINKEGNPTYEAKDIGLISLKFERFLPDVSIYITDAEQTSYFQVMLSAAGKIDKNWQNKSVHRTHGRMTFKGQKMSSRLGGVPTAKDTLDTLIESVKEIAKSELSTSDLECIAISALKYTILRTQAGKNINFDPETSLSFEGDSGPYLLYSTIRAKSILDKVQNSTTEVNRSSELEVLFLEKLLYRFPKIIERSVDLYAPHHVAIYLTELASAFNSFYASNPILVEGNAYKEYHLSLVKSFYLTMKNGLHVLGISIPSRM